MNIFQENVSRFFLEQKNISLDLYSKIYGKCPKPKLIEGNIQYKGFEKLLTAAENSCLQEILQHLHA